MHLVERPRQVVEAVDLLVHGGLEHLAVQLSSGVAAEDRLVVRVVERYLLHRHERGVVFDDLAELPAGARVHALARGDGEAGREHGAAQHVAHDVHVDAVGQLSDVLTEGLHVVLAGEAVELLLVDADDAELLEGLATLGAARAEVGVVAFGTGQHEEELGHTAAEPQNVEGRLAFTRHLQAVDAEGPSPHVIGGGRPQRQGGDLPQVQTAVEWRLDDLPVADNRLFGVPAGGLGLVVGPDAQREAKLIRLAVAVGDDDVAGFEVGDGGAHVEHLAERGVTGVDAPAARLGNVDGVGRGGVGDVVLGRHREDAQVYVGRSDVGQLELVELDDLGDVHVLGVAADALAFAGDRLGGDGIGTDSSRHRRSR